jgi:hypothetical protein
MRIANSHEIPVPRQYFFDELARSEVTFQDIHDRTPELACFQWLLGDLADKRITHLLNC